MAALRAAFAISAAMVFAACSGSPAPQSPNAGGAAPNVTISGPKASIAEADMCRTSGGGIQRAGMRGHEMCIIGYADAGKICSDSADCLGDCRGELGADYGEPASGTCQINNNPFGCFARIEDGKAGPSLCVD